jgi:hypothetical protein
MSSSNQETRRRSKRSRSLLQDMTPFPIPPGSSPGPSPLGSTSTNESTPKRLRGSTLRLPHPPPPPPPPPPLTFPILKVLPPETIAGDQELETVLSQTNKAETVLEARKIWTVDCSPITITGYFDRGDEGILYKCLIPGKTETHVVKLVCTLVVLYSVLLLKSHSFTVAMPTDTSLVAGLSSTKPGITHDVHL